MSTLKSSDDHLTLNADGSSKNILFQADGVQKASISSAGLFTSTTIDATALTGNLPAIDGSNLTGIATPITALNNATESELVTVGSTTTELDAESGLTYNGSTLAVTGALTATGTFSSVGITDNATVNAIGITSYERCAFGGYNGGTIHAIGVNANHGAAGDYSELTGGIGIRSIAADDSARTIMSFWDTAEQDCGTITDNASSNTAAYNTSSDYRLKENLVPLADSITRLKLLKPYSFDWKKSENTTGGEGFVAHELDEVVPLAVTGEKDAMKPEV